MRDCEEPTIADLYVALSRGKHLATVISFSWLSLRPLDDMLSVILRRAGRCERDACNGLTSGTNSTYPGRPLLSAPKYSQEVRGTAFGFLPKR